MLKSKSTYKYLDFVKFSQLYNWSVQYLNDSKIRFTTKYPLVQIKEFLTRNKTTITVQDEITYQRVTIRVRNGGVIPRDKVKGTEIGTKKQFRVSVGQFILSKIDARNGAMGIIPEKLDGAIVTQDFLAYDVDTTKINPQYLVLVSTTKQFIDFCQSCSSGTTNRQRVDEDKFLNIKVPVPPLDEQNRLVEEYNAAILEQSHIANKILSIENDMWNFFNHKLFIKDEISDRSATKDIGLKFLYFANFRNINQWGVDFIKGNYVNIYAKYPTLSINNICKIGSGGTPSRSNKTYFNGDIPWIKTGELLDDYIFSTEEYISEEGLLNSSAKWYPENSIIIAMYGATIGKTAKLGIKSTTNQACAVLYDFNDCVIEDYVWLYLQSQKERLKQQAYGGAQPNINASIIANYSIPIPPIEVQTELVSIVCKKKAEIKSLEQEIKNIANKVSITFENQIFD
jgi:restriction endonuclease S subunit